MKKTLITAVTLAACAATQLFAQNVKEGVITFALTKQSQYSVSTSSSVVNAGNWSQGPKFYKTKTASLTASNIICAISFVLHNKNPNYYIQTQSPTLPPAKLVLVQGELGGFFGIGAELADATTDAVEIENNTSVDGFNLGRASVTSFPDTRLGMFTRLATGRNIRPVPAGFNLATEGAWPPGHHQPWGQIFIRDLQRGVCHNVTPFFSITVQECYDCYYLNSFISDATFGYKQGVVNVIPPCCGEFFSDLYGSGKDRYYMTLTFDNTYSNPYLNDANIVWVGKQTDAAINPLYAGVVGLGKELPGDGITPDLIPYIDVIRSGFGVSNPYVMRFTLNGIMAYSWSLKFVNAGDVIRDFVGTATYTCNGYGFIGLICSYLSGTASIAEKILAAKYCCIDMPWYDGAPTPQSWYGVGWNKWQYPWASFFGSPINVPAELSMHLNQLEWFEAGWQWPSVASGMSIPALPTADSQATATDIDGKDTTSVPSARGDWNP
jgi:hypothetical protein